MLGGTITDGKIKALEKFFYFRINGGWVLQKITVQVFNILRVGVSDIGKILHERGYYNTGEKSGHKYR
jgi:hypothetical protein